VKSVTDYKKFRNVLPYASEIFGVYQPMLAWKGKNGLKRISQGTVSDQIKIFNNIANKVEPKYNVNFQSDNHTLNIDRIEPGVSPSVNQFSSIVIQAVAEKVPTERINDESIWNEIIQPDFIKEVLNTTVKEQAIKLYKSFIESNDDENMTHTSVSEKEKRNLIEYESKVAGVLLQLKRQKSYGSLKNMYRSNRNKSLPEMTSLLEFQDPFDRIKLDKDLKRVGLSPIGIAHIFRQYFFEFDNFLGPPVSHVWLSPGATVDLIEINTKKTIVEKTLEQALERI
jgi:hypothetical protein